jgi:hypothetical protein
MYILGIGILAFLYMYHNFNNANQKKYLRKNGNIKNSILQQKQNLEDKNIWDDKISIINNNFQNYKINCEVLKIKMYKRKIEKFLKKDLKLKENRNTWSENIKLVNKEIINNVEYRKLWLHNIKLVNNDIIRYPIKKRFKKCLVDLETNYNYCRWVYDNNINKLSEYKLLILDFKAIYNYETNEFISQRYVKNLSTFSHKHGILFVIISELHPKNIPEFKFINKNNIITPYHYKDKTFGGLVRLKDGQLNSKATGVSINKIILDIFNRYGMNFDNSFYIGINLIPKLKCLILDLKSN